MLASRQLAPPSSEVTRFFKALADDTRLAIVRMLALTDLKAGEIVQALRAPQNAVSYHLRLLSSAGLVRDHHSSLDARDIYYSLDLDRLRALYRASGESLHPGFVNRSDDETGATSGTPTLRVLFICTHNSARSQLAEGILRKLGGEHVEVSSAGSSAARVHPVTIQLLREMGIDPSRHVSKTLDQFLGQSFDYIITVCDRARESCPVFPGDPKRVHWSLPDPTIIDDPDQQRQELIVIRNELERRINYLLSLPHPTTGPRIALRLGDGR